ncbi:unnamed protein product [Closterium sp. Naga37s-1]|nr:unnamed protein product [Closterium sp. Naga37s-1]
MKLPYRPSNPEWGRFTPHGVNTFVFISAHRVSPLDFAVIGLSPRGMRSQWRAPQSNGPQSSSEQGGGEEEVSGGCVWVSYEGPHTIKGSLEYLFPGDHGGMPYETIVIRCNLDKRTPADPGEYLFMPYETIVIRCNLDKPTPADPGGALFYHISGRDMLVYREDDLRTPSSLAAAAAVGEGNLEAEGAAAAKRILNPPRPLPHHISFCSLLIDREHTPARVLEHMQYLLFFGADDFIFYDGGGFSNRLRDAVARFTDADMLQVVDLRGLADLPARHNVITMNDCLYRTRFTSEWVISLAFDELPHVVGPFRLSTLLAYHAGRPWLSMGSYSWHIELCLPITAPDHWLQQRMVFRSVHPTCHPNGAAITPTITPTIITTPPPPPPPPLDLNATSANTTGNATTSQLSDPAAAAAGGANASVTVTEGPSEPLFSGDPNMCLGEAGMRRVMFDPRQVRDGGAIGAVVFRISQHVPRGSRDAASDVRSSTGASHGRALLCHSLSSNSPPILFFLASPPCSPSHSPTPPGASHGRALLCHSLPGGSGFKRFCYAHK